MAVTDPYRVLQVTPSAEQEVVNAAYRALALKYHPDRDASSEAARRMQQLNEAFALVRDPVTRARWDAGHKGASRAGGYATAQAPSVAPPPRSSAAGSRLEFGRYAGWTLLGAALPDRDLPDPGPLGAELGGVGSPRTPTPTDRLGLDR
jgi:curved DNA-binding protein CbpA